MDANVPITRYAWEQTAESVKIFAELDRNGEVLTAEVDVEEGDTCKLIVHAVLGTRVLHLRLYGWVSGASLTTRNRDDGTARIVATLKKRQRMLWPFLQVKFNAAHVSCTPTLFRQFSANLRRHIRAFLLVALCRLALPVDVTHHLLLFVGSKEAEMLQPELQTWSARAFSSALLD
eukprot:TRINITY_DN44470_c0_g1_i1.p1 TRINITY_DN44470_c0_g1~~TRINITY_DN44470_c0_g1_i1.p1  ORF type:complete len:176 (-),score=30.80 TRINITY_DN44470_c0_g1_i1:171-698(-)